MQVSTGLTDGIFGISGQIVLRVTQHLLQPGEYSLGEWRARIAQRDCPDYPGQFILNVIAHMPLIYVQGMAIFLERKCYELRFAADKNPITVDPAFLDILQIIPQHKQVRGRYQLKIPKVREQIGLHHCNCLRHHRTS
ncbi:hypothetical protein D9M69_513180 [compost metagenome]